MTRHWSREVQVVAYLDKVPSDANLASLLKSAESMPEVLKVDYITRQQAFDGFKGRLGDDAALLDGLDVDFYRPPFVSLCVKISGTGPVLNRWLVS